jgi:hypothetical protein
LNDDRIVDQARRRVNAQVPQALLLRDHPCLKHPTIFAVSVGVARHLTALRCVLLGVSSMLHNATRD